MRLNVEAVRYIGGGNFDPALKGRLPEWVWQAFENRTLVPTNGNDPLLVRVGPGRMERLPPGDWLVRASDGELFSCPRAIYEACMGTTQNETR